MTQASLFEDAGLDRFVYGKSQPYIRHEDHSNPLMRKPFIFWDGEGYTDEFGKHHYWLLANSLGDKIIAPRGRSIERYNIARLLLDTKERFPDSIHCGFALGYDFTCTLRGNGLSKQESLTLKSKQYLDADGYIWKVRAGKQLDVHENGYTRSDKISLNDTWGFFQRSFINALDEYFGVGNWPYSATIKEMKAKRSTFDREHDEEVMQYNDYELELGVLLMEELRDRLFTAGMPIRNWYGPGAIASGLMDQWKIKRTIVDLYSSQPEIAQASQFAYAGGRFELFKCGHINGPVYQYDINSAYPWAIAQLPNWADGVWKHVRGGKLEDLTEYCMVRIRWRNLHMAENMEQASAETREPYPESIPFPFWRRSKQGNISYPSSGIHGWYWSPEVKAGAAYLASLSDGYDHHIEIEEYWEFIPSTNEKPFSQVPVLYKTRLHLKEIGNGAHIGIKLGLNSLYGKLAQQIGWTEESGRKPPYHMLAAAGYVTAKCRSLILEAMALDPTAVIAVETDGIFSTRKLPLPVGTDLGAWDYTAYEDMWYFQSGFRFGLRDGKVVKPATRGIPVADIDLERIKQVIVGSDSVLTVKTHQFITLALALARNKPDIAGQWVDGTKDMVVMCEEMQGKRLHDWNCPECYPADKDGVRIYDWDKPHLTFPSKGSENELSYPHKVLWSTKFEAADYEKSPFEHFEDGLEY